MALQLGDEAPDFTAITTEGPIRFHDWLGNKWGILFSHPAAFDPVCTTEFIAISRIKKEFTERNVRIISVSMDSIDTHRRWSNGINKAQKTEVNFPMIADEKRQVTLLYDMIHPNANDKMAVRSVFVIGADKKIKLMITYPLSTARNFDEILRAVDSLQFTSGYSVATPVSWKPGENSIIGNSNSDEDAQMKFPGGFTKVRSYLRYIPQPNAQINIRSGIWQQLMVKLTNSF